MRLKEAYFHAVANTNLENLRRLSAIEWLVSNRDEDRRTGRTRTLAMALVRSSLDSPKIPVDFFDHVPEKRGITIIMSQLQSMLLPFGIDMRGSEPFIMAGEASSWEPAAPRTLPEDMKKKDRAEMKTMIRKMARHALHEGLTVEEVEAEVRLALAQIVSKE